jgi:hypothetical protein
MSENRKREGSIHVDLQGYKAEWLKWCEARQVTPSEAFRQIVARLISKKHDTGPRPVDRNASEKPTVRKEVALTPSEYQRALDLARGEGYVITKWIVALVRARLTGSAQFGQHELEKLGESNLRLLQIGRNLNQIAKTLNAQPWERTAYRVDLIEQLSVAIKEHTKAVSEAMTANADRWRIK